MSDTFWNKWEKTLQHILLNRLLASYVILAAWILVLAGRLVFLQIYKGEDYHLQAERQRIGFVDLSAKRGDILDRRLEPLAISIKVDSVFIHPEEVTDRITASKSLAPILLQSENDIHEKLLSNRPFVYLARRISPRQTEQIRNLKLSGVYFQEETKRIYPGRDLAAHVLGFVGFDNEGLSGLEYLYDDFMKGEKTRIQLRFDAKRKSYRSNARNNNNQGNILVLNIDSTIQHIVQQTLEAVVAESKASNASAIVMNPNNGEVLAMASYPTFNPNRYADFSADSRRNRSILDLYEPGSTFKTVTFSAVLNEGLAKPSESVDCRVETLRLAGKTYKEAKNSFGILPFNTVLAKSSNVGTIKLGLRLGKEKFHDYIRKLGFGQKTDIDLPGEQEGLLRPPSQWSKLSIGALSIGQELGATPLQVLIANCAIANGGEIVSPRIVSKILTPQGEILYEGKPLSRQVLSRSTTDKMKIAMSLVVSQGTGRNARLSGYSSGGKTGTSQKFVDGRYSDKKFLASYVGFAPLNNPVLSTIIVIDEPQNRYHGGQVAAPAFKHIMDRSLVYLKVPQDQPITTQKTRQNFLSLTLGNSDTASDNRGDPRLDTWKETILTLIEKKPPNPQRGTTITIETDAFPLPDFSGLSLREVARQCVNLGLHLKAIGTGKAVGQRPTAGSKVSRNTVCEIFFQLNTHASTKLTLRGENQIARGNTGNEPRN